MGLPLRNGRRVLPKKGALAERQQHPVGKEWLYGKLSYHSQIKVFCRKTLGVQEKRHFMHGEFLEFVVSSTSQAFCARHVLSFDNRKASMQESLLLLFFSFLSYQGVCLHHNRPPHPLPSKPHRWHKCHHGHRRPWPACRPCHKS